MTGGNGNISDKPGFFQQFQRGLHNLLKDCYQVKVNLAFLKNQGCSFLVVGNQGTKNHFRVMAGRAGRLFAWFSRTEGLNTFRPDAFLTKLIELLNDLADANARIDPALHPQ